MSNNKLVFVYALLVMLFYAAGWISGYISAKQEFNQVEPEPVTYSEPIVHAAPLIKVTSFPLRETLPNVNFNDEQKSCLALNVYHEAKNQSANGQRAVAFVTLNRVVDKNFPNNICDVVKQARTWRGKLIKWKCSFTWWCDGKNDTPREVEAWAKAQHISEEILHTYYVTKDITQGARWYHAAYVKPLWSKMYTQTTRIGDHIFYR